MNLDSWLSRPVWLLAVGLLLLASALFYEWPGWWGGLAALAGVVVLAAWALGYGASGAERREERRTTGRDRRGVAMPVGIERRSGDRRGSTHP